MDKKVQKVLVSSLKIQKRKCKLQSFFVDHIFQVFKVWIKDRDINKKQVIDEQVTY